MMAQLHSIGLRVQAATGASRARVVLEPVPSPRADELAVHLGTRIRTGWLYVSSDADWRPEDLERISGPLVRLIDVALERERVADLNLIAARRAKSSTACAQAS